MLNPKKFTISQWNEVDDSHIVILRVVKLGQLVRTMADSEVDFGYTRHHEIEEYITENCDGFRLDIEA